MVDGLNTQTDPLAPQTFDLPDTTFTEAPADQQILTQALPQPTDTPEELPLQETQTLEPPPVEEQPVVEETIDIPGVSDIAVPEAAPITTEQEIQQQVADIEPPQTVRFEDTSRLAALGRSVGRVETERLQRSTGFENATPKQKKPLHAREVTTDFYNLSVEPEAGGQSQLVTINPVGGVANGRTVGRSGQTSQVRMSNRQLSNTAKDVTAYAARYPTRSSFENTSDAIALIYNNVFRYLPAATIPNQAITGDVINNFNLIAQWDRMSDLTRFRKTSAQLIRTARDLNFNVPAEATSAIGAIGFGFSAYNLFDNWANMSTEQRAVATFNTIYTGAQAYTAGSALIAGSNAAAGSAASVSAGASAGASAGSAGASAGSAGASAGSAGASAGSAGASSASSGVSFTSALGYAAAILGAYNIVTTWGEGGNAEGRVNGAASGAAVGSVFGPWGAAIGAVVGVAIGSINTGKSVEQHKRDAYRNHYEKNSVFERIDGVHHIQLADGTFYDVGIDGSDGRAFHGGAVKTYADSGKIPEHLEGKTAGQELRPYEVDFTNDLDFVTHLATRGLNLILNGGSIDEEGAAEAGQMNGYLTNAATSNTGREMSQENFTKSMANVRQFYSKLGITSKAQGIEVINALRQAGRISKDDLNAVLFGLEFAFSDNFETAQNLMVQLGRT